MNTRQTSLITLTTGILLATALGLHFGGLHEWLQGILISATVIAGIPIAWKAIQALRMKSFSIELLATIAVIGALFIGEYAESAAVTFLFLFGAFLEVHTLEKTRSSLKSLIDMAPLEATVSRDGYAITVDFTGELSLFSESVHDAYAEAMEPVERCVMSRDVFHQFLL